MPAAPRPHPINLRGTADLLAAYHLHADHGTWHIRRAAGTDDWQLLATLRGRGRLATASGTVAIEAGTVLLIPPRVPNDYGAADDREGWDYAWVHFLPLVRWRHLLPGGGGPQLIAIADPAQRASLLARVREMVALANGHHPRRGERSANALEDLLLRLDEWGPARGGGDAAIARLTTVMGEHPERRWSIDALARQAGLSRAVLLRRFRAATGSSPHAWLEELRLDRAAFLLRDGSLGVAQVAERLGWCSPFHFSARFRRRFGRRPSELTR